jgi:2-oxopent-4-enoate hydratase
VSTDTRPSEATLQKLADALRAAEEQQAPIAPISAAHPDLTVQDAYRVQTINVDARALDGVGIVGHKIGLTSKPMQEMLGVDVPDYGVLYADRVHKTGITIDPEALCAPRIEPEIAFVLGSDLPTSGVTAQDVLQATAAVVPAVEIIDSRIADFKIGLIDTVADNASCASCVVGDQPTAPGDVDLKTVHVDLKVNGETVQSGDGLAVLGDPAEAVAWLANAVGQFGVQLQTGHTILSGSITAAVPLVSGSTVVADFGPFGSVEVQVA